MLRASARKGVGGETRLEGKEGKTKGCGFSAALRRAILQVTSIWKGWSTTPCTQNRNGAGGGSEQGQAERTVVNV